MAEQKKSVTVYALSTCPMCKRVRRFLEQNGIAFDLVEVDLLDSGEQWLASKEVRKYNPSGSYPTVVIREVITGFDEERLKAALLAP
ncbi:MAG: glutaredoxin family protein [Nitrospirota bacterium]